MPVLEPEPRRIVFTGTKRWSDRLAALVNKYASDKAHAVSLPATLSGAVLMSLRCFRADAVVRVGFRPGMPKAKAILFDTAFQALSSLTVGVKWTYYWIGSDILHEKADIEAAKLTRFFQLSKIHRHLAGAPWFLEELEAIGIHADLCLFPLDLNQYPKKVDKSQGRRVLTYIPDDRAEFYGGSDILKLSKCFPFMEFDIVGGDGRWTSNVGENVHFHGWVSGIQEFLAAEPIVIRLVSHDAVGGTVREALAAGCHVIYTYDIASVNYVPFGDFDALRDTFARLIDCDARGELPHNDAGAQYAQANWDPRQLTRTLVDAVV